MSLSPSVALDWLSSRRPRAPLMCQRQTAGKNFGKNGGGCNVSERVAGAIGCSCAGAGRGTAQPGREQPNTSSSSQHIEEPDQA
ncbi:hypothetical protein ABG768_006301, partial [Culter alburnus]